MQCLNMLPHGLRFEFFALLLISYEAEGLIKTNQVK